MIKQVVALFLLCGLSLAEYYGGGEFESLQFQNYVGIQSSTQLSANISMSYLTFDRSYSGLQLFVEPGLGTVQYGIGINRGYEGYFASHGFVLRFVSAHGYNDRYGFREEHYLGADLGFEGRLFVIRAGALRSTESDDLQPNISFGLNLLALLGIFNGSNWLAL